jgi:hypothetical protein
MRAVCQWSNPRKSDQNDLVKAYFRARPSTSVTLWDRILTFRKYRRDRRVTELTDYYRNKLNTDELNKIIKNRRIPANFSDVKIRFPRGTQVGHTARYTPKKMPI